MSTKECYFCHKIVELFEFHRHCLKFIIKASHKYSVDIEIVINETLIEVNVDYKLLKQRINKKQKSDHLFENDFSPSPSHSPSPSPSLNSQRMANSPIVPDTQLPPQPTPIVSTNFNVILNNHLGGTSCMASRSPQKVLSTNQTNFSVIIEKDIQSIRFCESGKHFKDIDQINRFSCVFQEAFRRVGIISLNSIDTTEFGDLCFHGKDKRGGHLGSIPTTKWRSMHKGADVYEEEYDEVESHHDLEEEDTISGEEGSDDAGEVPSSGSAIEEVLENFNICLILLQGPFLTKQFCDNVLIPIYPKEKKELNQAISKYRSLIERAWCQIEKWSILLKYRLVGKEYQSSEDIMKIHNETMFIITSLYNIFYKSLGESSSLPSKHGNVFHGRPNLNYHREICL
ncbi:hypothetical protein ACTFIY_002846 [Dictyostelium cf. discoideum]